MEAWKRDLYGNTTELYHFGIPGMKWGVRKDRYKKSSGQRRARANASLNEKALIRGFNKSRRKYSQRYLADKRDYQKMNDKQKKSFITKRHAGRAVQNYVKSGLHAMGAAAGTGLVMAGGTKGGALGGTMVAVGSAIAARHLYKGLKESVKFYGNVGAVAYSALSRNPNNVLRKRYDEEYGKKK